MFQALYVLLEVPVPRVEELWDFLMYSNKPVCFVYIVTHHHGETDDDLRASVVVSYSYL